MIKMMSQTERWALKLMTIVALLFCANHALAVTLLSDGRSVFEYQNGLGQHDFDFETRYPSQDFADWTDPLQTSTVSSDAFEATGYSTSFESSQGFWGWEYSTFDITFSVAEATLMSLQGSIFGFDVNRTRVSLYDGGSNTGPELFSFVSGAHWNGETSEFDFSGLLVPGTYRLVIEPNSEVSYDDLIVGSADAQWNLSANFTTVPLPAAGWLMGFAMLGLWRLRK